MKKTMELAGITASVVIGAGFATGREIKTYFTKYGNQSYFIIAVVTVLLYLGVLLLLWWRPGKGKIIAVPYVFFSYLLMLAALGQLVRDYTSLPSIVGVVAGALMTVLGLFVGFGRFTVFSGVVTPVVAVVLVGMLVGTGVRPPSGDFVHEGVLESAFSTVQFIGYNFLSALIVLPEIGYRYTRREKLIGSGIGVLGLSSLMLIIDRCFLGDYQIIKDCEMPLIRVISVNGNRVLALVAVSLLCVIMVLSLCGSAVGLARMVAKGKREFSIGIVFVLIAVPLSLLGFGALMDNVYPLFGILGAGVCPLSWLIGRYDSEFSSCFYRFRHKKW